MFEKVLRQQLETFHYLKRAEWFFPQILYGEFGRCNKRFEIFNLKKKQSKIKNQIILNQKYEIRPHIPEQSNT